MPVRLRLARHGQRNNPYYHIVAINASKRRDARPLEKLGEYDPIPRLIGPSGLPVSAKVFGTERGQAHKEKKVEWNVERIRYWLGVGAEPTRALVKLLERGGVLQTPHKWQHPWSPQPLGSTTSTATSTASATSSATSSSIPPSRSELGGGPVPSTAQQAAP